MVADIGGGGVLLSKLLKNKRFDDITIFSRNTDSFGRLKNKSDKLAFTDDCRDIFADSGIQAVFIALPAFMHYDSAKAALMSGKHVFVEKPLAHTLEKAMELNLLAERFGLTLMVDHTFLYTSQISRIREMIDSSFIGAPLYYDSTRVALGNVQKDVNVAWDLAVHDLSILNYLFKEDPRSLSAVGSNFVYGGVASDIRIRLFYESGFAANIKVSWNFPEKVRDIFIGGSEKIIKYSDNASHEDKLIVYNCGYSFEEDSDLSYKRNGYYREITDKKDAVETAVEEFVSCCEGKRFPVSGGMSGCRSVAILEKIDISVNNNGKEVFI